MTVAVTMFKLVVSILTGAYLGRAGILTPQVNKKLSAMIVDVTAPLLVLASVGSMEGGNHDAVFLMLFGGAAFYCAFPFLGRLAARILCAPEGTRGIYTCCLMFANTSFMGYPVVESLYGEQAVFYTTIFNFGFNLLYYTVALYLIAKDAGEVSSSRAKDLFSPGLITGVAALLVYLTGMTLPAFVVEPCSFIGGLTSPLSMLIIGANMTDVSFREIFGGRRVYAISALRLLAMPLLVAFVLSLFTDDAALISMAAMTQGMPVAAMVAMAGSRHEKTARFSNVCVVLTTLCSLVTIPVLAVVFRIWFGG